MININGHIIQEEQALISVHNRGFNYGDAIFETMKVVDERILFLEDHYFRLMASMRILRMEIPMNFTQEFLESEIIDTIKANSFIQRAVRIKLMVNRKVGGLYLPQSNSIDYLITATELNNEFYECDNRDYIIELFKDFYVAPNLLSTLKTNNRLINVVGSVFSNENDFDNCLLLNTDKNVIEALNANLFLITGTSIKTPPLEDGCINGIIRKQILNIIKQIPEFTLLEQSISPFELQKADELFLTNSIIGIQPVSRYRKKSFGCTISKDLLSKLNVMARS